MSDVDYYKGNPEKDLELLINDIESINGKYMSEADYLDLESVKKFNHQPQYQLIEQHDSSSDSFLNKSDLELSVGVNGDVTMSRCDDVSNVDCDEVFEEPVTPLLPPAPAPVPLTEDELVVNLTSGATKLAVTPNEAKEIMAFISSKIASRTSLNLTTPPTHRVEGHRPSTVRSGSVSSISLSLKEPNLATMKHDKALVYDVQTEDINSPHASLKGSVPGLNLSLKGSMAGLEDNKNDLSMEDKHKTAKPKLSFLNKIKRSFKPCAGDKGVKEMNVRQLERPPSVYIPPMSPDLNGSIRSSIHGPKGLEGGMSQTSLNSLSVSLRAETPVLEILAKNPEMTSDDISVNVDINGPSVEAGSIKEINAGYTKAGIPGESRSLGTGQSRSKSLSKLYGSLKALKSPFTKRKSQVNLSSKDLTVVTPIPNASYANDIDLGKPKLPHFDASTDPEVKPRKRKSSFSSKLKRAFSFGKNDKKKGSLGSLSKSVPALNIGDVPTSPSISLPHIHKSASMDDIASIDSLQTNDAEMRYQIVLKPGKINKSCKCHVCTLVRRNVKQYCSNKDVSNAKYEVVLKMNMLGADFLNSECGSIVSNNQGYMIPNLPDCEVQADAEVCSSVRSHHSELNGSKHEIGIIQTKSELGGIVDDFKAETGSICSKSSKSSSSSSSSKSNHSLGVATGDEISNGLYGSPQPLSPKPQSPLPTSEHLSHSRQSAV